VALGVAGVAIGLALGVGIDIVRVGGVGAWLAQRSPAMLTAPPYEALGRVIQVDGRAIYLDCRGAGSPTVVLEAGFGSGAAGWGEALDGVAGFTRVCAWDRPGIGRSEARATHSGGETADALRAALRGAGERGPFVVVAHSLGGVYARLFAASAPAAGSNAVLAFVMLDTYEPDLGLVDDPALSPDSRALFRRSLVETDAMIAAGENLDWPATLAQLAQAGPVQRPAVLMTVDPKVRYVDPDPAVATAMIDGWRRAIAARYPNGRLEIVAGTGHMIHLERPSLVIDRIREVVLRYRSP
jgi:pimeloyl-ACP methyl ester carboxylesterase